MIFWTAILVGALFAWFAIKLGFFDTWTMLFNILISIYIAVFLAPVITEFVPAAGELSCTKALLLAVIALGVFFILYGISYTFITGQFNVSFPKIADVLFAPILGFLAGFLVLSFVALIICATPISQNTFAKEIGLNRQSQQANISYICWWCDLVHNVVATKDGPQSTEQAINWCLQGDEKKTRGPAEHAEPNNPPDTNDTKADTSEVFSKYSAPRFTQDLTS